MLFLKRLLFSDIPEPQEKWRPFFSAYVVIYAIAFPIILISALHFIFAGPGLGDEFTFKHFANLMRDVFGWSGENDYYFSFSLLLALVLINIGLRIWLIINSYFDHQKNVGYEFPMSDLAVFGLLNLFNLLFPFIFIFATSEVAVLLGVPAHEAGQWFAHIVSTANDYVNTVPTLFDLPRPIAFFFVIMALTFVHYWAHRLSHTRRFLWLVMHRPHHMPKDLHMTTTMPVFSTFPLFFLAAFPYVFVFGAVAKLFYAAPMYYELIIFNLIILLVEAYGHTSSLYEKGIKIRLVRWMSFFYNNGVYHVLHHSSEVDCERLSSNNTINIGSGLFACWDILFGTFKPLTEKTPNIGLRGNPQLVKNPFRLFIAGFSQICYELWHNRSLFAWFNIILGSSTYTPPVSHDFAIHTGGKEGKGVGGIYF